MLKSDRPTISKTARKATPSSVPAGLKPVVVVSQCLNFAAVRYNGAMLQDEFVRVLGDHVRFVQVCPEVGIEQPYLADQIFFEPYPRALLNLTDSGARTD